MNSNLFVIDSFISILVMVLDFLKSAKERVDVLEQLLSDIDDITRSIAIHFSEDPSKLKLSDCFTIFSDLIVKIETARKENATRKIQEERAAKLAAEKAMQTSTSSDVQRNLTKRKESFKADDVCVVDRLLCEIRRGEFKLKSRG